VVEVVVALPPLPAVPAPQLLLRRRRKRKRRRRRSLMMTWDSVCSTKHPTSVSFGLHNVTQCLPVRSQEKFMRTGQADRKELCMLWNWFSLRGMMMSLT
jgi:hypothetical protein